MPESCEFGPQNTKTEQNRRIEKYQENQKECLKPSNEEKSVAFSFLSMQNPVDRSQSLFYFVPQEKNEYHSQAGSTSHNQHQSSADNFELDPKENVIQS